MPKITPEDKVIHAISQLKRELAFIPAPNQHDEIEAMSHLRNLFSKHSREMKDPNKTAEKIRTEQNEIGNESPRVPIVEAAPYLKVPTVEAAQSPRVTMAKASPRIKLKVNPIKGNQIKQ